jgi:adenine-specific DNA-methyltransferase
MQLTVLSPRKSLNKAYLKVKPNRTEIDVFKSNFNQLLDQIDEMESEEFHKNLISDFLKDTYYKQNHFINTKGRNDLVIHNGKDAKSSVGVIIEAKKYSNKSEMVSKNNLNTKAFQELVLYFLRERITGKNLEVKNLIITNIYEWYIFDVSIFEKIFVKNRQLVKDFEAFENGRLSGKTTDVFYSEIAKPYIDKIEQEIEFTYFDLRSYDKIVKNSDKEDDKELIALFKLLSPEHLLKLPFTNDSNTLDKSFYSELLHIIGLTETKVAGKRLIERHIDNQRHSGSILEDTIIQLDSLDKISRLEKAILYGETKEERLFNVALTLNITWINRILFLKLLEAQLVSYHKGDKSYTFLNSTKIKEYDDLNTLFFQVLAKDFKDRNEDVKKLFEKVPYLNSSLFEPTELEHQTVFISNLKDDKVIPILSTTVLKDEQGKKRTGSLSTLQYLFEFLNAYDFSGEGTEDIQEDNKTLINASVLGLIFEKINGYKDGSFFTPGMITMYMCRETIRKAVVQKFNEVKGWEVENFDDLYNKIDNIKEANQIVNNIKICDPAVGSGHFLVSALNEMIAVKNDLKILCDKNGNRLKEYHVEVENDELIITDEDGKLFEYNPNNKESQRVQETLFHEKQTIIENCLFGVDINPNSVKICRLRLWIELLKNAYYKTPTELETLPNIDINIKNGNSLISRFGLDSDLKTALKNSKISIEDYKNAVADYRNAVSKEQKWKLEKLIEEIKTNFRSEIHKNSKELKELNKLRAEYYSKYEAEQLFETELTKAQEKDKKNLEGKIKKIEDFIEEIKNNKIYENAFEWRFEFPEILDNEGNFIGFDAIIGNPPYIQLQKMGAASDALQKIGYETFARTGDIYSLFYELGHRILKDQGLLIFITSNKWMRAAYGESLRKFFAEKTNPLILIDFGGTQIFDTATVDTNILLFAKDKNRQQTQACIVKEKVLNNLSDYFRQFANYTKFSSAESWVILSPIEMQIKEKIERIGTPLKDWGIRINYGIKTGFNDAFIIDGTKRKELIEQDPKSEEIIRPLLRGRDIKRYSYEFADLYLITTFPSLKINIEQYPAVKQHLLSFGYDRLKQTGDKGARKKTNNQWFETQDSISYWEDFSKQKIVWKRVGSILRFSYDESCALALDSTCFATGQNIKYLVAILNSKFGKYLMRDSPKTGTGDLLISVQAIEPLLIPIPEKEISFLLEKTVDEILIAINNQKPISEYENKIDLIIYTMLGFTDQEIEFIELQ